MLRQRPGGQQLADHPADRLQPLQTRDTVRSAQHHTLDAALCCFLHATCACMTLHLLLTLFISVLKQPQLPREEHNVRREAHERKEFRIDSSAFSTNCATSQHTTVQVSTCASQATLWTRGSSMGLARRRYRRLRCRHQRQMETEPATATRRQARLRPAPVPVQTRRTEVCRAERLCRSFSDV